MEKIALKMLSVLCISLFIISCVEPEKLKKRFENNFIKEYEILVIDKCEYIMVYKDMHIDKAVGFLAHKGNCKNTIHIYNK